MRTNLVTQIAAGIVLASAARLHAQYMGPSDTAYGVNALPNAGNTGGANSAFGGNALLRTTGTENTAVGFNTLFANTAGVGNTAVGGDTFYSYFGPVGNYNTAIGASALSSSTVGSYNTATGYSANGNYMGNTGTGNVAYGVEALLESSGSANTAVGAGALAYASTGSGNIALGSDAGINVTTGSYNIHIANYGVSADNYAIKIGTQGTQTSAYIAGIYGVNTSGVPVHINSNGQLGTAASSRRFKERITDVGDSSNKLLQLRPVNFYYKPEYDDGSHLLQYGLIAEEVEKVYPEMVAYDGDGQIMTVKYQMLAPLLLSEAQKQKAEIQVEREKDAEQAEQIRSLAQRLAALEARLSRGTVTLPAK